MMTRAEHIEWAKNRALVYIEPGEFYNSQAAIASILSDLTKHEETMSLADSLGPLAIFSAMKGVNEIRSFIEGIN